MGYEVLFEDSAAEDLSNILVYEIAVLGSIEQARARLLGITRTVRESLSDFPDRHGERPYGSTETLRRKHILGKYSTFYWIDEAAVTVHVDRVLHSKADFTRIHFGN